MNTDRDFMERCLQLAREARRAGETAVGSLVVRSEELIREYRVFPLCGSRIFTAEFTDVDKTARCYARTSSNQAAPFFSWRGSTERGISSMSRRSVVSLNGVRHAASAVANAAAMPQGCL